MSMKKGVITIYLTITFTVLLSMFFASFEAARISAYRVVAECAFQSAVISGFGEYHKELLKKYDVFFVDLTYQSNQTSENKLAEHVSTYLNDALPVPEKRLLYANDFFGDATASVSVSSQRHATDLFGSAFKKQATDYMKDLVSADFVNDFLSLIRVKEEYSLDEESFDSVRQRISDEEEAAGMTGPDEQGLGSEDTSSEVNVSDEEKEADEEEIKTIRCYQDFDMEYRYFRPLELLVLKKEAANKSAKIFNPTDVPSGRLSSYKIGDLELLQTKNSPADEIIFTEYIMQKCSNYTEEKEGGYLCYEAEYIIAGRDNDSENLGAVMEKIYLIRTAANMLSLKKDKEKSELIDGVAEVLGAITEIPPKVIAVVLLCMWAGGESVYDMQELLNGERVSLIKDADDFHLSLSGGIKAAAASNIADSLKLEDHSHGKLLLTEEGGQAGTELSVVNDYSPNSLIGSYSGGQKNFSIDIKLSYEDYLRLLIYTVLPEIKTMRMLDVVELSIRQTKNNETFRMDYCVDAAVFTAVIHTSFSAEYDLKRRYSYF